MIDYKEVRLTEETITLISVGFPVASSPDKVFEGKTRN